MKYPLVQINVINLLSNHSGVSRSKMRRLLQEGAIYKFCEDYGTKKLLHPIQWCTPITIFKYGRNALKVDFSQWLQGDLKPITL